MAKDLIELVIAAKDKTGRAFTSANNNLVELEKNSARVRAVGNVFAAITGGAIAGALAMEKLTSELVESLTALDNIGKASKRLGLTTDELQELRIVAQASGVEITAFDTAFQRFARRAGQAKLGTGELVKTFDKLNIELDDSNGKIKTNAALFKEFGEKIAGVADENVQLALTMSGVDTEGVKLIEMFRTSGAEQQKIIDKARELGQVYESGAITSAEHYLTQINLVRDAQDKLTKETVLGMSAQVLEWEKLKLGIIRAKTELLKFIGWQALSHDKTVKGLVEGNKLFDEQITRLKKRLAIEKDPQRIKAIEKNLEYAEREKKVVEEQIQAKIKYYEKLSDLEGKKQEQESKGVEVGNEEFSKGVQKVTASLEEELRLLSLTSKERFIYNQTKKAGTDATYEEINAIKKAAAALYDKKEAIKSTKSEAKLLTKTTKDYKKESESSIRTGVFGKAKEEVKELTEETEKATKEKKKWLSATSQSGIDTSDAFDPINLTPTQAAIKATEIKAAMQQVFDTNPVQVKVNTPNLKQLTNNPTSSSYSDPLTDGGSGLSALSMSRQALKQGNKQ